MLRNAVVLGGLGQAGTLLSQSLRDSGVAVKVVDARPRTPNDSTGMAFLRSDVAGFAPELRSAIASSECVCVCLPEKITLLMASRLAAAMPAGSLWLDTLSVKSDVVRAIGAQSGRVQALSINPMFAPAMGWAGNTVAVVGVFPGPKSEYLKELLRTWGARLEEVGAEEHDRLTAAIQVATHAAVLSFGAALLNLNFDLERALRLSTPPHRLLLTLLHRMTTQSAEVYWDIQAYHPLGGPVRKELIGALQRLEEDAGKDEPGRFVEMFSQLRTLFETRDELFKGWAKQAFALRGD
jgi:4-amino-4-deoxyprephenate dehydrogenase